MTELSSENVPKQYPITLFALTEIFSNAKRKHFDCWTLPKEKLTCQYHSQSDLKPERVDRKGLLGPGDGNARGIRLKIDELIDGIVSWQTPRYLADILTKFRIVDTQRDGGHLLYNIILFPTQLCKNNCL